MSLVTDPTSEDTHIPESPESRLWLAVIKLLAEDLASAKSLQRIDSCMSEARSVWVEWICDQIGIDHSSLLRKLYQLARNRALETTKM